MSTSITRDYSLKDIAEGKIGNPPKAVLTAILAQGSRDDRALAQQALLLRHPELKDKMPDSTAPKHAVLARELSRILVRQVRPLIWLRQIIELLDRYRGDIPREFLLGWMAIESDGNVKVVTSRPERGYFQIDWKGGEAQEQLKLDHTKFLALSTDREYSIRVGIQLAQLYRNYIRKHYPTVPDGSELLWRMTKARHGASGLLTKALAELAKAHQKITWEALAAKMSQTKLGPKIVDNVNHLFKYANLFKPLVATISTGARATKAQELEGEARGLHFSGAHSHFGDGRGLARRPLGVISSGGFATSDTWPTDSDTIRSLQSALADKLGMRLQVTGFVGPATRRALRIVQQRSGLPVTGSPDTATLSALGIDGQAGGAFDDSASLTGTSWIPRFPVIGPPRFRFRRR
jgi:hypothetical protein